MRKKIDPDQFRAYATFADACAAMPQPEVIPCTFTDEALTCQDCGTTSGVDWTTTPDRTDGRHFPRCGDCHARRLASAERTLELLSPARPSWFDESFAGERWDEDC